MRNVQYYQDDVDDPNLVPELLISVVVTIFICLFCIPEFLFLVGFFKMMLGIAVMDRDPFFGSALLSGASIWFAMGRVKLKQREQENMRRRQEQQGYDDEEEELGWRYGPTTQMTNMTSWREGRRQKNRREPVIGYGHINSKYGEEEEEEEENQMYEIKNGQFTKKSRGHQGPMLMLKQSNALADDDDDKQEQSSTRSSGEEAQEDALLEKGLAMFANVVDDDAASGKGVGQFDEHKQTAKECKEEEEEEVRDDFSLMV